MSALSMRSVFLPTSLKAFGSLSFTSFGTSRLPASSAISPNVTLRPDAGCVTTPSLIVSESAGTASRAAAGSHPSELLIEVRLADAHVFPVRIHLLGDDHRQRSANTLTHIRLRYPH